MSDKPNYKPITKKWMESVKPDIPPEDITYGDIKPEIENLKEQIGDTNLQPEEEDRAVEVLKNLEENLPGWGEEKSQGPEKESQNWDDNTGGGQHYGGDSDYDGQQRPGLGGAESDIPTPER